MIDTSSKRYEEPSHPAHVSFAHVKVKAPEPGERTAPIKETT